MNLDRIVNKAIETIKKSENLALSLNDKGFNLAFSGGKDSLVIYKLCQMAGVKFEANMQLTTVDPPQLLKFVKENYPDVILNKPKLSLFQLIVKKGSLPTRQIRYCCESLKEHAGVGTVTIIGIRAAESAKRAKRQELTHSCIKGSDKFLLSPILQWSDRQVWQFIKDNNLKYCELYDKGFKRIGCIFCPMANTKIKAKERELFPKFENAYKIAIKKLVEQKGKYQNLNGDVDEIFNWWMSNDSIKVYQAKKLQLSFDFYSA